MVRAIAESGGVIGVVAVAAYIAEHEATVARWVDHVDHLVQVAGIDAVAVGCDFYDDIEAMGASYDIPSWRPPGGLGPLSLPGMTTWEHLPVFTAELTRRGYGEADLRKIYRDNVLRVLGEVVGS